MNIKELLLSVPILFFILWVFAAPLPQSRIERVCEPINWVGNLATSTTALSAEQHTGNATKWSEKLNYSCRYMVWRLFYQKEYLDAVQQGLVPGVAPEATQPTVLETQTKGSAASEPAPASLPQVIPVPSPASK